MDDWEDLMLLVNLTVYIVETVHVLCLYFELNINGSQLVIKDWCREKPP